MIHWDFERKQGRKEILLLLILGLGIHRVHVVLNEDGGDTPSTNGNLKVRKVGQGTKVKSRDSGITHMTTINIPGIQVWNDRETYSGKSLGSKFSLKDYTPAGRFRI